jgi:hypothetical protein
MNAILETIFGLVFAMITVLLCFAVIAIGGSNFNLLPKGISLIFTVMSIPLSACLAWVYLENTILSIHALFVQNG